uniref:Uncharacterized protein n=1 Tax=Rubinisphaera brasiliensis (strain ATCC 49424 / DSM 5305 / JCM 21570 / IAM 15109 / NBRC 103401 / IFAM 1448) TaxID=756272 RepID=F0SLN3_RUBBR|nr:hypothetical protein Plabr_1158 [Rubinisphaera brasiliensis DSM 5305]
MCRTSVRRVLLALPVKTLAIFGFQYGHFTHSEYEQELCKHFRRGRSRTRFRPKYAYWFARAIPQVSMRFAESKRAKQSRTK